MSMGMVRGYAVHDDILTKLIVAAREEYVTLDVGCGTERVFGHL